MAAFGPERFAPLVGRLARLLGAYFLAHSGVGTTFVLLAVMALLNIGLVEVL